MEGCPFQVRFLATELLSKGEVDAAETLNRTNIFSKIGLVIET
jgi:hypothetical protein